MPITTISRDTPNNVSVVRIATSDTLAQVGAANYITSQTPLINLLNKGVWGWFISDTLLVSAEDGNALYEFTDDTFSSLILLGGVTSGTVSPGLANQIAVYSANGNTVSGVSTLPSLVQVNPVNLNNGTGATANTFYAGNGTWKTVAAVTAHSIYTVYVAKDGNNTTGNGSINAPYATVAFAMGTITTATAANPFNIVVLGSTIAETVQIQLKPFVSITGEGENVVLNLTSDMILHSSWNTAVLPTSTLSNFSFTTSNINFDGTALTNATTALIFVNGVQGIGRNFTVKGSANFDLQAYFNNCIFSLLLYSNAFVQLNSCITSVTCNLSKADAALRSATGFFFGSRLGTVTINSLASGPGTTANFWGNQIQGLTGDGAVVGILIDASSFINSPLVMTNGATYGLTSKSDGLDSDYTAVNYTPAATLPILSSSLQGHLRGIDNKLGTLSPSSNAYIYVYVTSTGGADVVGNGGISKPYATISYAISQITDNSITKRYMILCYGNLTETTLSLKPWVLVQGNSSSLAVTTINLHASFSGTTNALCYMDNFTGLTGAVTLNFTGATTPRLVLTNLRPSAAVTWTITGPATGSLNGIISRNFGGIGFTTPIDLGITNFDGEIVNNCFRFVALSAAGAAATHNIFFGSNIIVSAGSFLVTSTSVANINVNCNSSFQSVALILQNASTGTASLTCIGSDGFSSVLLDGTLTTFKPDLLSVTPTFSSGATDTANIVYGSLAASVTAGFTPTNYTAANTRVRAHLEGIDTKLGTILPATYTNVFVYVSSTNGVDAVGRGGPLNPYATITYATSQITDATASKQYAIICYGVFTEASLKIKSYVRLIGNGSALTCTNPVNLDATFASSGSAWIEGFGALTGNISLDFTSLGTPSLYIANNQVGNPTWTITGPSTLFMVANITNNISAISGIALTITNSLSVIKGNSLGATTLSQTNSGASNALAYLVGNIHTGVLTISTTGTKGMNVNYSGSSTSSLAITTASSGIASLTGVGFADFTGISLSGTFPLLRPDLLSVTPTFSAGATDSGNIIYKPLAASLLAGFTPTNYTAANTRVLAHLQGIDTQLGVLSPATNTFIYRYVSSTGGTDAVGNGSILKPYATISYALTQITDNTSAKRYIIFCEGVFTETTLTMKPWILLEGDGSFLTVDTWALDAAFTTANALFYVNNFIISSSGATSSMAISFASGSTPRIVVTNLKMIARLTLNVTGPTTGNANVVLLNNTLLVSGGNFIDLTLSNCSGIVVGNVCRSFVASGANVSGLHTLYTSGNIIGLSGGGVTFSTSSSGASIDIVSNDIYVGSLALTLTAATGAVTLKANGCVKFTSITISGGASVLTPDLLSVTPAFAGGAVDGTNCLYPSLAASVTAGFSPTNYTAANTRTRSHLEGIDSQLANFNVGNKSLGTTTNDNAVALHVGEYVSSSVLVAGQVALTTATPANVTSISLTAGDWTIMATGIFNPNVLTTSTLLQIGISTTSATLPTLGAENNSNISTQSYAAGLTQSLSAGSMRLSLSATTTVYFVARADFSTSTMSVYGFIGARRVR